MVTWQPQRIFLLQISFPFPWLQSPESLLIAPEETYQKENRFQILIPLTGSLLETLCILFQETQLYPLLKGD